MADILPFRALRYSPDRVSVGDVVTQPYDKITPEMHERYYLQSPYNLVRIILGKREKNDDEQHSVYTRAAEHFRQWRTEGVLAQDPEPTLYAYAQQFSIPGSLSKTVERRGFIALGRLEPYDAGVVFRHEQTHSAPKADRLNLLRATRAHFGQIFMLFNDPAGEIDDALAKVARHSPNVEVCDEYNVRHRLWLIPGLVDLIHRKMVDKKLIIADGHHRYETALNYQAERRQEHGSATGEAPYDRVMMTFINMYAEGVVILPTHRVLSGLASFSAGQFRKDAAEYFEIEEAPSDLDGREAGELLQSVGAAGTALLAITPNGNFLLRTKPGAADELLSGYSLRQRQLDVVVLHKVVLERLLGISEQDIHEQKHISYLRVAEEAIAKVRSGAANVVFLMNPVRVDQVRDVAFAGEVLPQKSTDFYPKLLSGLTVYALE
jgi:uncharacterized protein (DUF1015 family)